MDSSTLTVSHIGDLPDIPCREVSVELIRTPKHCGEDIERGGGGGETSVSVGSEMEKRETEET